MNKPFWMPPEPETLRINLQLFAEDADPDADKDGEEDDAADKDADKDADKAKAKSKPNTFTQDDVKAIAAKEAKKAREKLLRDLGIDPSEDITGVKDVLAKNKERQEAEKSDLDKAKGAAAKVTKERDDASAKAQLLERKFEAVSKGVPADKAEKYVKLAESYLGEDEDDFGKALDAALKDFPVTQTKEKRGSTSAGANPPGKEGDKAVLNAGQEAAQRRRDANKRAQEALKQYQGR